MKRFTGLQNKLKKIGEEGCHFLFLMSIIERETKENVDIITFYDTCLSKGWIREDLYVNDALAILEHFTKAGWCRYEAETYKVPLEPGVYVEEVWHNPRTKYTHFRDVSFDTYKNSVTVKEGTLLKYYIYKKAVWL